MVKENEELEIGMTIFVPKEIVDRIGAVATVDGMSKAEWVVDVIMDALEWIEDDIREETKRKIKKTYGCGGEDTR